MNKKIKIGFFGTPEYSVITLDALQKAKFDIAFVVTVPDKPQGRKMILTASPVKIWAEKNNIPVFQPEKLKSSDFIESIKKYEADVFIVMAYGKMIPDEVLNIPRHRSLNIHPSLLPKYRGSCPIESSILADDRNTGVTIIRMDSEMDHGPIVAQKEIIAEPWPPVNEVLGKLLIKTGSELLIAILPDWIVGKIQEKEQNHAQATYTKKIEKEDGCIDLEADAYKNFLKIRAYHGWPSAYFFKEMNGKKIRIKITRASFADGKLTIEKVVHEGRTEINYLDL